MNRTASPNVSCAATPFAVRAMRNAGPAVLCSILLVAAYSIVGASIASATVIPLVHYRAGENDPGATAGGSANTTTVDYTTNGFNATLGGSALYTNSTPYAPSTLALDFPGSASYSRPVVTTAQNNWGMEAWVRFDTLPTTGTVLFYNGNAGSNGFGLFAREVSGTARWHTLFGGLNFGDTGIAVTGSVWQHVAAVRDNGTMRFYLNGAQVGNTFTTTPNVPAGNLSFGNLDGQMDELRVFSFNPGEFNPSTDLLFFSSNLTDLLPPPAPEPTSALLVGCGVLVLAGRRRKERCGYRRVAG